MGPMTGGMGPMTDRMFEQVTAPAGPLALSLRPYQAEAIDAIFRWFEDRSGNPLVIAPTGAGKSVIMTGFIHRVLSVWPKERFLVLTHVRELIDQNHKALRRAWPDAPSGIVSAGLKRREYDAHILFAGIQTCFRRAAQIGWVDLVLVDECHLIPQDGFGMYRTLLNDLLSMNPKMKIIGLTATPYRTDSGRLDRGKMRIFEGIAYDCDILSLIEQGYLSPITSRGSAASISTDGVHRRGGDFIESELEERALEDEKPRRAVEEIIQRAGDRKSWLLFCCSVKHAEIIHELLLDREIPSACIFGHTPGEERDKIIADFKSGRLRAVVNMNVLTTGFDAPNIDLIALLRPTCSPGLYVQMVGRGLRIAEGKKDCLVLDFGNNVMRHGSINKVKTKSRKDEDDGDEDEDQYEEAVEPDTKECPECRLHVAIMARQCPECGHEFIQEAFARHEEEPDEESEILDREPPKPRFETWKVVKETYRRHQKPGKPDSLRVEYYCGGRRWISEWVCFEHQGFARRKAEQWWRERGGAMPAPLTIDIALVSLDVAGHCMRKAVEIVVDNEGEYPSIASIVLGEVEAGLNEEPWIGGFSPDKDYDAIPF